VAQRDETAQRDHAGRHRPPLIVQTRPNKINSNQSTLWGLGELCHPYIARLVYIVSIHSSTSLPTHNAAAGCLSNQPPSEPDRGSLVSTTVERFERCARRFMTTFLSPLDSGVSSGYRQLPAAGGFVTVAQPSAGLLRPRHSRCDQRRVGVEPPRGGGQAPQRMGRRWKETWFIG
jgi:hypothetical protein